MLAACIEAYCSIKPQQFINAIMKYIRKLHVHVANVDKWYIILNNVLLNNCRHFIFDDAKQSYRGLSAFGRCHAFCLAK